MKFVLVLFVIPAVVLAQVQMSQEEKSCRDQVGASEEDVEMFQSLMVPEERTTKCYYSCVMQAMGYSDGQRFDKKRFIEGAQYLSDENQKIMRKIANRCQGVKNKDHCELAADIIKCILN